MKVLLTCLLTPSIWLDHDQMELELWVVICWIKIHILVPRLREYLLRLRKPEFRGAIFIVNNV